MGYFKNDIGRPSNETLKKRKRIKIVIIILVVCALLLGGISIYKMDLKSKSKQVKKCNYTFYMSKCNGVKNETVKKIQEMLWNTGYLSKYYKSNQKNQAIDGVFGKNTHNAVVAFQKAHKSKVGNANGIVGGTTFKWLVDRNLYAIRNTNLPKYHYYVIQYKVSKNIDSADNSKQQIIINGTPQSISSTNLSNNKSKHVGWVATSTVGRYDYVIGCTKRDCRSGAKGYIYTSYDKTKNTYYNASTKTTIYPYVYNIGASSSQTGWINGQVINFSPMYCSVNQTYNKQSSECRNVGNSNNDNTKPFSTLGVNWTVPKKYNYKNVTNAIGSQAKSECLSYAAAYGVYILGAKDAWGANGSNKVSKYPSGCTENGGVKAFGATTNGGVNSFRANASNLYKVIVSNINANKPIILYAPISNSWDHWVLVVGYKTGVTSVKNNSEFLKSVLILDPNGANHKLLNKTIYHPFLKGEGRYYYWKNASDAKACH